MSSNMNGSSSGNLDLVKQIEQLKETNINLQDTITNMNDKITELKSTVRQFKIWSAGEWATVGGSMPSGTGSYGTIVRLWGSSVPNNFQEASYYIFIASNGKFFTGIQTSSGLTWNEK